MKPFSFRLDKILDYRKYKSKRAQIALVNAQRVCLIKERKVDRLTEKRMKIEKTCSEKGSEGIDVPVYQIYRTYLKKIDADLEKAHDGLKDARENVMAKKIILKQESIKKKTLETLKDLQYHKYKESSAREDQKILDEIVITQRGPKAGR